MLDSLNKYGLTTKYGIAGFFGGIIGAFISDVTGLSSGSVTPYIATPIAAAIGGAIAGWFRERKGKTS